MRQACLSHQRSLLAWLMADAPQTGLGNRGADATALPEIRTSVPYSHGGSVKSADLVFQESVMIRIGEVRPLGRGRRAEKGDKL
jgi:hypothetical protein